MSKLKMLIATLLIAVVRTKVLTLNDKYINLQIKGSLSQWVFQFDPVQFSDLMILIRNNDPLSSLKFDGLLVKKTGTFSKFHVLNKMVIADPDSAITKYEQNRVVWTGSSDSFGFVPKPNNIYKVCLYNKQNKTIEQEYLTTCTNYHTFTNSYFEPSDTDALRNLGSQLIKNNVTSPQTGNTYQFVVYSGIQGNYIRGYIFGSIVVRTINLKSPFKMWMGIGVQNFSMVDQDVIGITNQLTLADMYSSQQPLIFADNDTRFNGSFDIMGLNAGVTDDKKYRFVQFYRWLIANDSYYDKTVQIGRTQWCLIWRDAVPQKFKNFQGKHSSALCSILLQGSQLMWLVFLCISLIFL